MTLAGSLACKQGFLLLFNTLVAQMVKNLPACRRPGFDPQVGKIPWRRAREPTNILAWRIPWTEEPGGLLAKSWTRLSDQAENSTHHTTTKHAQVSLRGGLSHFRSCLQLHIEASLHTTPSPSPTKTHPPTTVVPPPLYSDRFCQSTSVVNTAPSMSSNFQAVQKNTVRILQNTELK